MPTINTNVATVSGRRLGIEIGDRMGFSLGNPILKSLLLL